MCQKAGLGGFAGAARTRRKEKPVLKQVGGWILLPLTPYNLHTKTLWMGALDITMSFALSYATCLAKESFAGAINKGIRKRFAQWE